jgi:hypothetical protein
MKKFAQIAVFSCLPGFAFADTFDGVYKQTVHSECSLVGVDGGSLEISDGIFHGVEMQCRMTNPIDINDMEATIYQMECSGEGQTWTERAIMMNDAEETGIIMVWNGYAFRYERCEEGEY